MQILIIEPFYTGSHAQWAEGYTRHSQHNVDILKLSGAHWKWRMHGGAVTLAESFLASEYAPDLIIATDMLDVTTFLALTRSRTAATPTAMYFHENQLTYPWSPKDRDKNRNWDRHYGFINFASALAADRVFFNSRFHHDGFLEQLPLFLREFPDHHETRQVDRIRSKSVVLPLGLDLQSLDQMPSPNPQTAVEKNRPLILWNHRWEYDKNPEDFFAALQVLARRGRVFDVALLGETFDVIPKPFLDASRILGDRIVQSGFVSSRSEYREWLWRADVLPVTSQQDFFGGSVVEAMFCECVPLLPRRLAFPELVPEDMHAGCFYDEFDELVEMLDTAIQPGAAPKQNGFRIAARKYAWQEMAPLYDKTFEEMVGASN